MRLTKIVALCALSAPLSACGAPTGPLTQLPEQLSTADQHLVQADNAFAFSLFREINRENPGDTNVFISPLSVAMALGMTWEGAAGATRDSMAHALSLDALSVSEVNQAYRHVIDLLRGLDPNVTFTLANSIWYRQGYTPVAAFQDSTQRYFDAQIQGIDFSAPDAASTINGWVSQQTAGKIPSIVPDPIPRDIVMYLIDAIYFKGAWTYRFDKRLTTDRPFALAGGGQVSVPTMASTGEMPVRVARDSGLTVIELSYGREAYAMTIVLPDDAAGADALATNITQEQWNGWIAALDSTSLPLRLPKFTLSYGLQLNDALKALGMGTAFDPTVADFSNMFTNQNVFIDDVRHKTYLDVNEEGTEAAGATSVGIGLTSAPAEFAIDRPFLLAIRERLSGTILFLGKIGNPTAGN